MPFITSSGPSLSRAVFFTSLILAIHHLPSIQSYSTNRPRSSSSNNNNSYNDRRTRPTRSNAGRNTGSSRNTHNNSPISISKQITETRTRNSLQCPHFGTCPGCITDTSYEQVPTIQSAKLYFSSSTIQKHALDQSAFYNHHTEEPSFYQTVIPSEITQWRTQAKLVAKPKSAWGRNGCIFGLYERRSHNLIEIPNCTVHHPSINRAIDVLSRATQKVGTEGYREDENEGGLRYVQMQVERATGRVCLTLIWNAENMKGCQPGLSRLVKECKKIDNQLWHSIWCHTNASYGNSIFVRGEKNWHPMDGSEFVREALPGTDVTKKEGLLHFTPMAFRQGNMDGFDAIAMHVAKLIPGGSRVTELYAGVGLLGLSALSYHGKKAAAAQGNQENDNDGSGWYDDDYYNQNNNDNSDPLVWLRCSDENPANPRCFQKNVNSMPSEITGRMRRGKQYSKSGGKQNGPNKKKQNRNQNSNTEKTLEELMQEMMDGSEGSTNQLNPRKGKVTYMVASAAKALHEGQALGADVIIVDPPRKGLEEEVLVQLCKPHNPTQDYTEDPVLLQGPRYAINWANDAHTLIYVSCGFDALARDCDRLLKGNAGWKIESATGYVLFPGSNHVETVAVFKRKAGRDHIS